MIYLIDDRTSRQEEFGWTSDRFFQYCDIIRSIKDAAELNEQKENILLEGNVVLFHESFMLSTDDIIKEQMDSFKQDFQNVGDNFVVTFSGSISSRFTSKDEKKGSLPVDVLYENLDVFLAHARENDINLRYLAFGEKYAIEEQLRERIVEIINNDISEDIVSVDSSIFFASVSDNELEVIHPFADVVPQRGWDIKFINTIITDAELDALVHSWFDSNEYDRIYIPLCFGKVLSDFMGLRLALHIRLTNTINRDVPIFIYGEGTIDEVCTSECFDILKTKGVYLISGCYEGLKHSLSIEVGPVNWICELPKIHISIPANIGDNHSVANRWAISRWQTMFDWKGNVPSVIDDSFKKSLYLKYLESKSGEHQKFKKNLSSPIISGVEGKKIVYIDDEYNKGWESLLSRIFTYSKADFLCYKGFDKHLTKEGLIDDIKQFIDNNEADCYIVDLRLHEADFDDNAALSGHEVAKYIKSKNQGNQMVVFTASNKVWNLKKEVDEIGALDYILKESPEMGLNKVDSMKLFQDFARAVRLACEMSYLKDIVRTQEQLKKEYAASSSLDSIIDLLQRDKQQRNQDLLGAALLAEMVFIEDFIKGQLGLSISKIGENTSREECELIRKDTNECFSLLKRVFVKRDNNKNVIEISDYKDTPIDTPDGFYSNIKDNDVMVVTCGMVCYLNMSREIANTYIRYKSIRNKIVHQTSKPKISSSDVKCIYNDVIIPLVQTGVSKI